MPKVTVSKRARQRRIMAEECNGICKASAVPLLVQQFGLDPNERIEN